MFARDQGQGVCAEVFWLPGPEQRCICGLREGRVLDALISGGGLDACEELPTGSWVRDSLAVTRTEAAIFGQKSLFEPAFCPSSSEGQALAGSEGFSNCRASTTAIKSHG